MLLLVIAAVTVLWFVLSRMHFVVFVGTSIWGLILTILGGIVAYSSCSTISSIAPDEHDRNAKKILSAIPHFTYHPHQ